MSMETSLFTSHYCAVHLLAQYVRYSTSLMQQLLLLLAANDKHKQLTEIIIAVWNPV